jgi:hypothetical protein
MSSGGPRSRQQQPEGEDEGAQAVVDTGIRDQRLVVSGWAASHADTGTPGPHVHLSTNDWQTPVGGNRDDRTCRPRVQVRLVRQGVTTYDRWHG